jgi:aryl carrier-like protein
MLDAFLDEPDLPTLTTLHRIISSGETLPTTLAHRCHTQLPHTQLHNLYGPTETTIDVTWHHCTPTDTTTPIGQPIANTHLTTRDHQLHQTPIGIPGELCIAGTQLARGYLHNPALTAQKFVPNPNGPPGTRIYRTGDLAVWQENGELQYLGRLDNQIKLHGHRIEPAEIEATLLALPAVRNAAVTLHHNQLIAYLVTHPNTPTPNWTTHLTQQLPTHMIPTQYIQLPTIPLTPNGKLDRTKLPTPTTPDGNGRRGPESPAEKAVAEVWRSVLGRDPIHADDDFFAIGGDSIHSLRVVARLRTAGYDVRLQDVFAHPTLHELAVAIPRATTRDEPVAPKPFSLISPTDLARLRARGRKSR